MKANCAFSTVIENISEHLEQLMVNIKRNLKQKIEIYQ